MKKIILAALISGITLLAIAQEEFLPKGFSPKELELMQSMKYEPPTDMMGYTTPPSSPVRNVSEWEEMSHVIITWTTYQSVLKEIVKAAQKECIVYILCSDSNSVRSYLTSNGVPLTNIRCKIASFNSVWVRDYGPNNCYTNDVDSLIFVDWIYNRPRPQDDASPSVVAADLNIPIYLTTQSPYNITHTGGNFMSDGLGTAFGSKLTLTENSGKTTAQIDAIHNSFMGITRYPHMDVLPYDGIHHIDMHIKLLNEETLLVGQYPSGISDGPQIEANIQYILSNYNSAFGTPYKIIRIPMPPEQSCGYPNSGCSYLTYANATILNKSVLVPQYYQQYDTTAIRIWKEAMPGYNIVGINSNSTISASGSIHCITHEVATKNPLLISHQGLSNTNNCSSPYTVTARIQHRSGIGSAKIWWTTDTTQGYQSVNMSAAGGNNWTGSIPVQANTTDVYYYIEATSVSGKSIKRPMPAPKGYYKFKVTCLGTEVVESSIPEIHPIYPNPSKGITCIPVSALAETTVRISLVDVLGNEVRVIHEGTIPYGEKNFFINTSDIAGGTYAVVVVSGKGKTARPLVIR